MLVDCSNCRIPLQLPSGARVIRCSVCQAVTRIADPRALPSSPYSSTHNQNSTPPALPVPSPYGQMPAGPPAGVHGRKKAVVCGVSYLNSRYELKGCMNDAKCMRYLLINRFNFPEASVLVLTGNFLPFFVLFLDCCVVLFDCSEQGEKERKRRENEALSLVCLVGTKRGKRIRKGEVMAFRGRSSLVDREM